MTARRIKYKKIRTLITYKDWLEKSKHELQLYERSSSVYDMANCFLSLNALPEWIKESEDAPDNLRVLATEKILVMKEKFKGFVFDENSLDQLDHQLRFIRIFCNHSKHGERKQVLPSISMASVIPGTLPMRLEYMEVGNTLVVAVDLLRDVVSYWDSEIGFYE